MPQRSRSHERPAACYREQRRLRPTNGSNEHGLRQEQPPTDAIAEAPISLADRSDQPEHAVGAPVRGRPWKRRRYAPTVQHPRRRPPYVRGHRNTPSRSATRRHTPGHRKTARQPENSQLAGHFRRWWQVLGSNQRGRADGFTAHGSWPRRTRMTSTPRRPRHDFGLPPSAMRPSTPHP